MSPPARSPARGFDVLALLISGQPLAWNGSSQKAAVATGLGNWNDPKYAATAVIVSLVLVRKDFKPEVSAFCSSTLRQLGVE